MDTKIENVQSLKAYIGENYKESQLIDYELMKRNCCREANSRNMTQKELNNEFSKEGARVWKFLADRCNILGIQ